MSNFKFNGDWEFEFQFDAFKGLQSRRGAYTSLSSKGSSDGMVRVVIEDELNDAPDPYPEQINAINYLIENPDKIKQTLFKALEKQYPKFKKLYGYDKDDEEHQKDFPPISALGDFKNVFSVNCAFILTPYKNDIAYIGLGCRCTWDEEHGLGFLLHKNRCVNIGQADIAFSGWEALKDNETYEQKKKEWDEIRQNSKRQPPKKYLPHPKYGKLKPLQKNANDNYEFYLIRDGFNDIFFDLIEKSKIDINGQLKNRSETYLEMACRFKNNKLVEYLLKKGADIRYALHQCVGYSSNPTAMKMILNHGGDINQRNASGKTILYLKAEELASYYDFKMQRLKRKNGDIYEYDKKIEILKKEIKELIEKGADPTVEMSKVYDVYSTARRLSNVFKKEMEDFIEKCFVKNGGSKRARPKENLNKIRETSGLIKLFKMFDKK